MSDHHSEPPNAGALPVVRNIFDVSSEFLGQYKTWLEQNPPSIPITQIVGFTQFSAQYASIDTDESTSSAAFADLATVGPSLTGLADGQYLIIVGGGAYNTTVAAQNFMAVSLNGAAASLTSAPLQSDAGVVNTTVPMARAMFKTLKGGTGGNSVVAKYATSAGTAHFLNRWLVVLKVSNA